MDSGGFAVEHGYMQHAMGVDTGPFVFVYIPLYALYRHPLFGSSVLASCMCMCICIYIGRMCMWLYGYMGLLALVPGCVLCVVASLDHNDNGALVVLRTTIREQPT